MRDSKRSTESFAGSGLADPVIPEACVSEAAPRRGAKIATRDYIVLPLLSLATVILLFAGTEISTRIFWPASERGYCMNFDPIVGPHGRPDCTSIVRIPEAPASVVHHFNHCGYRSDASCGPKSPGTFRIAILGSSFAEGYMVPYDQILGSRMKQALRRAWSRPVEFENLAAEACPPIYSYRHITEALKLQPDAIVLVLNPWDLEQDVDPKLLAVRDKSTPIDHTPAPAIRLSPIQQLQAWTHESRTMLVLQHYMLQNEERFIRLYLMAGGDHTAFVRYPFSEAWRKRFEVTDTLLAEMAQKTNSDGVAFLVLAVPERAQVLMLHRRDLPAGVDPYAFTREISRICAKHGIPYVDGLKAFSHVPDPEKLFYVVDGHATPLAHRIMGESIARKLIAITAEARISH